MVATLSGPDKRLSKPAPAALLEASNAAAAFNSLSAPTGLLDAGPDTLRATERGARYLNDLLQHFMPA